jgi:hypothetical protein
MTVRDLLMQLATTNLFRARWTREIQDEWVRNLLDRQPELDKAKLAKTQALMNSALRDCLIEGYKPLIDSIKLPDPGDRHVVAAAIKAGADVIVTYNLKGFSRRGAHAAWARSAAPGCLFDPRAGSQPGHRL